MHSKDPSELIQVALLLLQLQVILAYSSMSEVKKKLEISRHFFKCRCPCYICRYFQHIRGWREGAIRGRQAFIYIIKSTTLRAHSSLMVLEN